MTAGPGLFSRLQRDSPNAGSFADAVRRDEDGFHVVLPSAPEFAAEQIVNGADILPIASIKVSKDKWSPGREDQTAKPAGREA